MKENLIENNNLLLNLARQTDNIFLQTLCIVFVVLKLLTVLYFIFLKIC